MVTSLDDPAAGVVVAVESGLPMLAYRARAKTSSSSELLAWLTTGLTFARAVALAGLVAQLCWSEDAGADGVVVLMEVVVALITGLGIESVALSLPLAEATSVVVEGCWLFQFRGWQGL